MESLKKYKGIIILIVGIMGIVIINWNTVFGEKADTHMIELSNSLIPDNSNSQTNNIRIDIKGEVNHPGMYEVSDDLRIGDAITIAGGITDNADINDINLAESIFDEMVIVIPKSSTSDTFIIPDDLVKIVVEIKGEVCNPSVYEMNTSSRVGELIQMAGGVTNLADLSKINQAIRLEDEMVITIPEIVNEDNSVDVVKIAVEVKGEVNSPGIYYLDNNSRVNDLIELAGGLKDDANILDVEMARILIDGESIIIPAKESSDKKSYREIYVEIIGEVIRPGVYLVTENNTVLDLIYEAGGVTVNCDLSRINWDIKLCLGATIYIPAYGDDTTINNDSNLININKADLETLIKLPGIGQILGQRIIDYRAEYGGFQSVEDVMKVSGIKDVVYEQIKDLITV